jgi:hypothetical protein
MEGAMFIFKTDDKTVQILTNRAEEPEIITTLAGNGDLRIKSRL